MRILTIHADYIEVEAKQKAIKEPEAIVTPYKKRYEEVLVVFSSIEEGDENTDASAAKLCESVTAVCEQVKVKNVLLYPLVHLTSKPSKPGVAKEVITKAEQLLNDKGYTTDHSPFGWYKGYTLKCKGHPLSELSRELTTSEEEIGNEVPVISKESISDNPTYERLIAFLDKNKATYRLIDHPPEGRTAIVSTMRGNKLSQAAHCIVIQVLIGKNEKKYVLAVVPGDAQVDFTAIKERFQGSYASFADKETAEKLSESVSGTILPFSFNPKLELIVDPRLLETDELFFNAARLDRSLALKTEDYKRLAKPRLESIAKYQKQEKEGDVSASLKQESTMKSRFVILDLDGKFHELDQFNYAKYPELEKFANYEHKKQRVYEHEPPHIKIMKDHSLIDYEPGSDPGNFRFLPKGRLIKKLLEKAITDYCTDAGAMEVETPIMYDYEHPSLKKYLNRFPARQYVVTSDEKKLFLRFAACFGQFLIAHDTVMSYKQLPLKMFELTKYSFRREQGGELAGLKRLRAFTMPDMHTFCTDVSQAKTEFETQFDMGVQWMKMMDLESEAGFRVQEDFFNENKDWYMHMVKHWGKPVLLELFKERYAYFITKFEFNFVDSLHKASALTTVQIDVENADTYDINYVAEDNTKKKPLILHASISGSLERVIYALLEREAMRIKQGKKGLLPIWLAPIQVRLIPVSEKQRSHCEKLLTTAKDARVRVDLDDRDDMLGKKIRDAERDWVPYFAVIGEKELESGKLAVTVRSTGEKKVMSFEELITLAEKDNQGKPFEKLTLAAHLSKRPII